MFNRIELKNYRAFPQVSFQPSRITVLLGPNNSGKSSIIQAIRLIAQTALFNESISDMSSSPLTLSGQEISVLDPRDLFSHRKSEEVGEELGIDICFNFSGSDLDMSRLTRPIVQLVQLAVRVGLSSSKLDLRRQARSVGRKFYDDSLWRDLMSGKTPIRDVLEIINILFEEIDDLDNNAARQMLELFISTYPLSSEGGHKHVSPYNARTPSIKDKFVEYRKEMTDAIYLLSYMSEAITRNSELRISTKYICSDFDNLNGDDSERRLVLLSLGIKIEDELVFSAERTVSSVFPQIMSDIEKLTACRLSFDLDGKKSAQEINSPDSLLSLDKNLFRVFEKRKNVIWTSAFQSVMDFARVSLSATKPTYIGPYRNKPLSVYVLPENARSSDYLLEVVRRISSNPREIDRINKMALEFSFHVRFDKVFESSYSVSIGQGLHKEDHYHVSSVGFGLVHLIPILDSLIGHIDNRLIIIEQPEAHLNPSLHSKLADLFVGIANKYQNSKIIIETHSDHFLSRLGRRMRDNRYLKQGDVKILYVEQNDDGISTAHEIEIDSNGRFQLPSSFVDSKLDDEIGMVPPIFISDNIDNEGKVL
jgi:hypothetical protein